MPLLYNVSFNDFPDTDWTVSRKIKVGPCTLVMEDEGECPDPDYIKVYLFTRYAVYQT